MKVFSDREWFFSVMLELPRLVWDNHGKGKGAGFLSSVLSGHSCCNHGCMGGWQKGFLCQVNSAVGFFPGFLMNDWSVRRKKKIKFTCDTLWSNVVLQYTCSGVELIVHIFCCLFRGFCYFGVLVTGILFCNSQILQKWRNISSVGVLSLSCSVLCSIWKQWVIGSYL